MSIEGWIQKQIAVGKGMKVWGDSESSRYRLDFQDIWFNANRLCKN